MIANTIPISPFPTFLFIFHLLLFVHIAIDLESMFYHFGLMLCLILVELRGFAPIGMMGLKKTEFKAHIFALIFFSDAASFVEKK